jgi:hypothetical protein
MTSIQSSKMQFLDTSTGQDRTAEMLQKILVACPELLGCSMSMNVFESKNGTGPREMAEQFGVPYLGALPMDKDLCAACESGQKLSSSAISSNALKVIVEQVVQSVA